MRKVRGIVTFRNVSKLHVFIVIVMSDLFNGNLIPKYVYEA